MDEAQTEATGSVLPEFTADVSTSDNDKALMNIWNKNHGPDAELKDPAMPASFAQAEGDHFDAAMKWTQLPMKERREAAAVQREFADLRKQATALGMKMETAADVKAVQDMLAPKADSKPAIDRDTQASLDTFKAVVPFAKDHKEASQFLNGWAEAIARDQDKGWSELLKAQGMGHLLRDGQPRSDDRTLNHQPEPAVAPYLQQWASKSGATKQDMAEMADIMSDPSWREIAGESDKSALDRAYKALQRRGTTKHARQGRQMDADLRGIAADIYRD
jgi:hypothetical protein